MLRDVGFHKWNRLFNRYVVLHAVVKVCDIRRDRSPQTFHEIKPMGARQTLGTLCSTFLSGFHFVVSYTQKLPILVSA
jgi:hypothetical protein